MQGAMEALTSGILLRGFSPALASVLMAAPSRKTTRAFLKKIYVLDERGEMTGEYVLDPDCPIGYDDFLQVLPSDGIGDRDSLYVGEYVFTAFQSGKLVYVLLSRGHLATEDRDWTALLLAAAEAQSAQAANRVAKVAPPPPEAHPEADRALGEREMRIASREEALAEQEAKLKADAASLRVHQDELKRQEASLVALANDAARMQDAVAIGVTRATKTLETTQQLAAGQNLQSKDAEGKAAKDARATMEKERSALIAEKERLEAQYRDATAKVTRLEKEAKDAIATLERERAETATRRQADEKTRQEVESRVAELTQRFASMADERTVAGQRNAAESDAVRKAMEGEKAELARERKFLQRRAIELLDREERVRDRETKSDDREHELARRMDELTMREQDMATQKALLAQAKPTAPSVRAEADEAKKDIERRVKIIQQKALELLDREEKLRRRAEELEAMEARLSGRVAAE